MRGRHGLRQIPALGRADIVEDVETDAEYADYRAIARAEDFRAVQSTPLIGRDGARLGIISTYWRSPHRPGEQDLRRLDLYARQAADFIGHCRMAKELRDSQALLQAVVDGSPDAIFLKDREGRMLLANPVTLAAIGKPAEECIGKTDAEFLPNPEDAAPIMANDRRIMDGGRTEIYDETVINASGTQWYRCHKTPYRDAQGKVVGLIGIGRDITAQKAAETALRESEERFRVLTQAIPSLIWETDAEGGNTFMSDAWCAYTGMTAAESAGSGWAAALHPEDHDRIFGEWRAAVASPQLFDCRYRLRAADGSYRWFLTRAAPLWMRRAASVTGSEPPQTSTRWCRRKPSSRRRIAARMSFWPRSRMSCAIPWRRSATACMSSKTVSLRTILTPRCSPSWSVRSSISFASSTTFSKSPASRRGRIALRKESVSVSDFLQQALETCQPLIDKQRASRHREAQ